MATGTSLPDIVHSTYIAVAPDEVYKTLTSGEAWDAWFTEGATVDARKGGSIQFRWKDFGAERWTTEDGGPVLQAIPNSKFSFQWSPGQNPTTVCITLHAQGPGTLVKLVESGYSCEDQDLKVFVGCATGWGEALTLLKFYLEHGVTYGSVPCKHA